MSAAHTEKRIYTLLAIVVLFLLCNSLKLFVNCVDMADYRRILACQSLPDHDYLFGFSETNNIISKMGNIIGLFNTYPVPILILTT
jgi:hypothetical protein